MAGGSTVISLKNSNNIFSYPMNNAWFSHKPTEEEQIIAAGRYFHLNI